MSAAVTSPAGEEMASGQLRPIPCQTRSMPKFSELMRQCVEKNLRRTDNMVPGEMRSVIRVDENTGQKIREWIGPTSFVLMNPACTATAIVGG